MTPFALTVHYGKLVKIRQFFDGILESFLSWCLLRTKETHDILYPTASARVIASYNDRFLSLPRPVSLYKEK